MNLKILLSFFVKINNENKLFAFVEFALRINLAFIMLKNAPLGTFIPLSTLGLDQVSYNFLMKLWDMGFLMYATKILELTGGFMVIFQRTSLLGILLLSPVIFSIINISFGLWGNFSSQHFAMISCFLLIAILNRKKLKQTFLNLISA